eukprot:7587-Eustigmatos_ZCMA.PRE.1
MTVMLILNDSQNKCAGAEWLWTVIITNTDRVADAQRAGNHYDIQCACLTSRCFDYDDHDDGADDATVDR